jgi:ABC-type antimicrobial peptide transport system permease subunit
MRKYHFNGPMDVPRFLIALIVIAFAGSAILTVVAVVALVAIIPVILWERLAQVARSIFRRKEA